MADEWDDVEQESSGKAFGGGGYGQYNGGEEESGGGGGWKPDAYANGDDQEDGGGGGGGGGYGGDSGRGRGRGRGRGGARGRGGGGGRYNGRENGDNNDEGGGGYGGGGYGRGDSNDYGGGDDRRGGGRGRGRGRGGGRGGRGGRNSDDYNSSFNNNKGENENGEDGGEPQKPREFYIPPEPTDNEDEMFNQGISTGINFAKYEKIPVKVSGENPPPAFTCFEESGLRGLVLDNVKKSGYIVPTPIQKTSIPIVLDKRDLMACAQTGSGKTAAFLLPIIHGLLSDSTDLSIGKPQALIVSPTRELSIQIFSEARKFALGSYLKISIVYGGTSSKHQGENIGKGCHILIATPGRLLDFVDKGFITFEDTRFIVLDEADRMLDMGFMESVTKIMNHPTIRPMEERQTLMFSATFPEEIQRLAGQFLNNYIFVAVGVVGGACSDVKQNVYEVSKFQKRAKLLEILNEDPEGTIVFVETKRGADFLASLLSETEFPTTSIHGDRLQSQREMALRDFKTGKMKVLIATSVAARGLDIKNVSHVINYDLPKSIDEYVHRIGRTGRVGNDGKATSFYDPEADSALAGDLAKILKLADHPVPDFLLNAGGGGGGGNFGNKFGGRDFRNKGNDNFNNNGNSAPAALEEEEDWA
ncbi:ATP-dependent RNA helicase vasa isoform X2 [Eupeodes corollae]|nr:ATP-dependent RNA helicase vasa isoform X2 [Eupeodes corollae]